jgi:hypothetical protein
LWEYPWQPVKGQRSILARATDGTGELQTDLHAEPYPSGATGWHEVHVNVSDKMTT